jgi:hypothetical protein
VEGKERRYGVVMAAILQLTLRYRERLASVARWVAASSSGSGNIISALLQVSRSILLVFTYIA